MDHDISVGHELVDDPLIRHIAHHQRGIHAGEVGAVARVGELIEDGNVHLWPLLGHESDEVCPNKAGAAGHKHSAHGAQV